MMELMLKETMSGEEVEFDDYVREGDRMVMGRVKREVVMVITASRGRAVIFKPTDTDGYYGAYIPQSVAVKEFMEQHRND